MPSLMMVVCLAAIWYAVATFFRKKGHSVFIRHSLGMGIGLISIIFYVIIFLPVDTGKSEKLLVDEQNPAPATTQIEPTTQSESEILTAQELLNEYQSNEVAADLKYRKQTFSITGIVQSVDKGVFDEIIVNLATSERHTSIHAYFENKYEQKVAKMSKGQKITLECTGSGMTLGAPVLRNCSSD